MPTRNRAALLSFSLASLPLNQIYKDFELIVIDDHSSDNTDNLLKEYEQIEQVRVIRFDKHVNRLIAFNTGMKEAKNEWICWHADDDFWSPFYLFMFARAIQRFPDARVFHCGASEHWSNGACRVRLPVHSKGQSLGLNQFTKLAKGTPFDSGLIGGGEFIYHREAMGKVGYFPEAKSAGEFADQSGIPGYSSKTKTLGNPWGDDFWYFWKLTREYDSIGVPFIGNFVSAVTKEWEPLITGEEQMESACSPVIDGEAAREKAKKIVGFAPEPENPLNTFVIPTVANKAGLKKCLKTIWEHTPCDFYVIVVNQGEDFFEEIKDKIHLYIKLDKNYGFAIPSNIGLEIQNGFRPTNYITLVNDDVEFVNKKWWPAVLEVFDRYKTALGVNPGSPRNPDGNGNPVSHIEHKEEFTDEEYEAWLATGNGSIIDGICTYCTVFRREFLESIRERDINELWGTTFFDESFLGSGEDYDLNRRAYLRGYRMLGANTAWVWHWWVTTKKKMNAYDLVRKGYSRFAEKWGENGEMPDLYGRKGLKQPKIRAS